MQYKKFYNLWYLYAYYFYLYQQFVIIINGLPMYTLVFSIIMYIVYVE